MDVDSIASVRTDGRSLIKGSNFFVFLHLQNEHLLAIPFNKPVILPECRKYRLFPHILMVVFPRNNCAVVVFVG